MTGDALPYPPQLDSRSPRPPGKLPGTTTNDTLSESNKYKISFLINIILKMRIRHYRFCLNLICFLDSDSPKKHRQQVGKILKIPLIYKL